MNYTRFITAKSAARKPYSIRVMCESKLCPSPPGWKWRGDPTKQLQAGGTWLWADLTQKSGWNRHEGSKSATERDQAAVGMSWLGPRGLFRARRWGLAQPADMCRVGRAGTWDRKGCREPGEPGGAPWRKVFCYCGPWLAAWSVGLLSCTCWFLSSSTSEVSPEKFIFYVSFRLAFYH